MKKPLLRWGLIILGSLVAALLIAAGVLFFLVSRIDVRAEIEKAVESATGRDLVIAGDVGVSFWPVLGLRAEQAALANVAGGKAPALAEMRRISLGVEIAPLFRREVHIVSLALDHPRIALEVDASGQPNWVLKPAAAAPSVPPAAPPAGPQSPTSQPQPAPAPGPAREPAPAQHAFRLDDILITDGEVSYVDLRDNSNWALAEVDLKSALKDLDKPMRIEGELSYRERPLDLILEIGAPRAVMAGRATPFSAEAKSELLNINFIGETTASAGILTGEARASGPSLRQLAAWSGAAMAEGYGLGVFEVSGRLTTGNNQFAFENASVRIDEIRGRGDFVISERHDKPYVSGRLEVFDLDLNPYLASTQAEAAAQISEAASTEEKAAALAQAALAPARAVDVEAAPSETRMDFAGLRTINADLELTTAAMRVQRMRIDRAQLSLVLNDGFMAATLHRLDLYGGSGRGRIELDARAEAVKLMQDYAFQGVDAHSFLTDAANLDNLEGRAELSFTIRTTGRTQSELIASADGRVYIEVVSGALRGVDLAGVSRTIARALNDELIRPDARTQLRGMSASFAIADGVLASDNMSFNTPDMEIRGVGVIDVGGRALDMRIVPRSVGTRFAVPFTVRGAWGGFEYKSDILGRERRRVEGLVAAVKTRSRE